MPQDVQKKPMTKAEFMKRLKGLTKGFRPDLSDREINAIITRLMKLLPPPPKKAADLRVLKNRKLIGAGTLKASVSKLQTVTSRNRTLRNKIQFAVSIKNTGDADDVVALTGTTSRNRNIKVSYGITNGRDQTKRVVTPGGRASKKNPGFVVPLAKGRTIKFTVTVERKDMKKRRVNLTVRSYANAKPGPGTISDRFKLIADFK